MKRVIFHTILPGLLPSLFFTIALTPVHVLGCRTRGLMAVLVASVSAVAALASTVVATRKRRRGDADVTWWIVSSLILMTHGRLLYEAG